MRTQTDVLRSVKRYVALALGPDFEVRISGEKGVFKRPYARVVAVPGSTFDAESWHRTRATQMFQVQAFPLRHGTPDESQIEALRIGDLIWEAFAGAGVGANRPGPDPMRGHPFRVPLYDYSGIPLRGPDAAADESRRLPNDYLKVEGPPSVDVIQEEQDELLFNVAANIRMSWLRSAAVPSTAPTTDSVTVEKNENG